MTSWHCRSVSCSLSKNTPAIFLQYQCWLPELKHVSLEARNLCFSLLFGRAVTQQYFYIFSQYLPILCFLSFSCQQAFSVTPQPCEGIIRNISKSFSWMLPDSDAFSLPFCKWGRGRKQILPTVHMCVLGILQLSLGSLGLAAYCDVCWSLGQLKLLFQKHTHNKEVLRFIEPHQEN